MVTNVFEVKVCQERRNRWAHLNYVEPFRLYNLSLQDWDHLFSSGTADNYTDRRHAYLTMNPTSVVHKIIQSLPDGVEGCQMF
eukprot:1488062-Rhodomonas_salina.1